MKKVAVYKDEISGKEFKTEKEAILSEQRSRDIANAFSFYTKDKVHPKDGNDEKGVQRTEEFYNKLIDALIDMVIKYEPWISDNYIKVGGLTRPYAKGYSMLGRFLECNDLYHWWCIQGNICPKCFREYGQMYYASNCGCGK